MNNYLAYFVGGPYDLVKVVVADNKQFVRVPIFESVNIVLGEIGETKMNTAKYQLKFQLQDDCGQYILIYSYMREV